MKNRSAIQSAFVPRLLCLALGDGTFLMASSSNDSFGRYRALCAEFELLAKQIPG